MTAAAWLVALLLALPHARARECLFARGATIAAEAGTAAAAHGVPVALLLAVGFRESQLGCDVRAGGGWGAPRRRGQSGADAAASALALGYRRCGGTPEGALSSFRWGLCRVPAGARGYGPADVLRLAARVAARVAQ